MTPVFWELVPPSGATINVLGGQLGNMHFNHGIRLTFPAEHQPAIVEWLKRTADFLGSLPQGQSMQVPPPSPLQAQAEGQQMAPVANPGIMPAQPPPPAAVGHNVTPIHTGAPVGHNAMPMPPAFGGASPSHHAAAESNVTPPIPPVAALHGAEPTRPRPANQPIMGHSQRGAPVAPPPAMALPQIPNPYADTLGPDNESFAQMSPVGGAAPPAPPAARPTEPSPPPSQVLHSWNGPYEIGVSQCTRCHLIATGTENRYCG